LLGRTNRWPYRLEEGTDLATLLDKAVPLIPAERAKLLENTPSLAQAHREAAEKGDTSAPDAHDDVDLHYVCFVKTEDGNLWELDGRRKGPLMRGTLGKDEDVLSQTALTLGPLTFLEREDADLRFSCVAIAPAMD
jgi:ubiquitin carboxyl-terminal hydrolase L3